MTRALMVIAPTVFRDEEYAVPKGVLEAHGIDVTTASVAPGECIGKLGMHAHGHDRRFVMPSRTRGTPWCSWEVPARQVFFDDADAHELARAQRDSGRVLAAICIAPSTLARAGLLDGVRATAFPSQEDDLRAHGAQWTGEPVTVDGRIVTGNGPEAAEQFGEAVAAVLGA